MIVACYRSKSVSETENDKNLADRLIDLLTPSTDPEEFPEWTSNFCPHLRTIQKIMDKQEWLVKTKNDAGETEVNFHNGAHFPLCVFTKNESARSEPASKRRDAKPAIKRRSQYSSKGSGCTTSQSASRGSVWTTSQSGSKRLRLK